MSTAPLSPDDAARVVEHQAFLRRLAVGLMADEHQAEDLVQNTLIYALERSTPEKRAARGWFFRVMNHLAIDQIRGERRRRGREAAVARPDACSDPDDLEGRLEVQARVGEAIRGLDEPYRSAILLTYYEGLSRQQVAERQGVAEQTVKTRLRRARERLREELRRVLGPRYPSILVLLVEPHPAAQDSLARRVQARTPSWVDSPDRITLVLCLVAAVLVLYPRGERPAEEGLERVAASAPWTAALRDDANRPSERTPMTTSSGVGEGRELARDLPSTGVEVGCRVVDEYGRPVAGAEVRFRPNRGAAHQLRELDPAVSDARGRVRVPQVSGAGQVLASGCWANLWVTRLTDGSATEEPVLVVGPRVELDGRVVDRRGDPVAGARVAIVPDSVLEERFAQARPRLAAASCRPTWTDADGTFAFTAVPSLSQAELLVTHPSFRAGRLAFGCAERPGSTVVLAPARRFPRLLAGTVVDAREQPVAGARVSFGNEIVSTDGEGRFVLRAPHRTARGREWWWPRLLGELEDVWAAHPDHLPVRAVLGGSLGHELVLRLGARPRDLLGRVLDEAGQPVAGAQVWVIDPTFFSVRPPRPEPWSLPTASAVEEGCWKPAVADAEGCFRLGGLLDRDYRLLSRDPLTGAVACSGPIAAREQRVLVGVDRRDLWARVEGRVRAANGRPWSGATVTVAVDVQEVRAGPGFAGRHSITIARTLTDAHGGFSFTSVPRQGAYLLVEGVGLARTTFGRTGQTALLDRGTAWIEGLDLTVGTEVELRVCLERAGAADCVQVFGPADPATPLRVRRSGPRGALVGPDGTLVHLRADGGTMFVPSTASVLALYRGAAEVGRVPLALVPGEVHEILFR